MMATAMQNAFGFDFEEIGRKFKLRGKVKEVVQINSGNINKTYKVTYLQNNGTVKSYLFQKVNTYVFKNPVDVMENIDKVTTHIYKKRGGVNALHFHHTDDGKNYYFDKDDCFWRVRNYFKSVTYNICEDLEIVFLSGVAFGSFQQDLQDFDASELHETIAGFHDTPARLNKLFEDARIDEYGRAGEVRDELAFIENYREKACTLVELQKEGKLPLRVTHNDTKINNVLFDVVSKKPLTVIDLDTVMPGLVGNDFGDSIRFSCNTAVEDEKDLGKVSMSLANFEAFAKGFLSCLKNTLTETEIDTLAMSAFCITVELAARFLDDYITGDKYFKICYPEHNLVRTRAQIALAKDMLAKMDDMERIIRVIAE